MLHKAVIVIKDTLMDNQISPKHLNLVLNKGLKTIKMIKEVSEIDSKEIKKIAQDVEAFMAILALASFYEEGN